jgi:ribosomal protein S18 acetylase RimI-like enzyme
MANTPEGRLVQRAQLSLEELREVEQLAATCVAADGGRLKLEFEILANRSLGTVNDFAWRHGAAMVGFLGIYSFGPQAEICGMVLPEMRRRAVFTQLFEAAKRELAGRFLTEALLVVDRTYGPGAAFARSRGGSIEHSEHRMVLQREPAQLREGPPISLRPANRADAGFLVPCLSEAFGLTAEAFGQAAPEQEVTPLATTFVIEREGEPVGTIRSVTEGRGAGIYGFAVEAHHRGRGIGRQALTTLVIQLVERGVTQVGLEVSCTNSSALGLYTSCGFDVTGTEDYYAVQLAPGKV